MHLAETQSLGGKVNHLAQMLPFLLAFRRPLNNLLGQFNKNKEILLPVTEQLKRDLTLIANAAITAKDWLPIPHETDLPPLGALVFVSDAARGLGTDDWASVASLGLTDNGQGVWYLGRGSWPEAV
jgi:hypothetical protein